MIFNMVGGGGGSGATLVVSSPVNVSVTASKDDKSYTKNSGSLGSTTFKGLATGTWTVTISGNGQTATRTIEITADYTITIAFFSATINITYPANSNCVVTDSSGQTVVTDTNAGTSTKTWTATVNATGTYTVTATATNGSGKSKSQSVEITSDGQSVSVELRYWNGELFKNGEQYTDITGGWSHNDNAIVGYGSGIQGSLTSDAMKATCSGNNGACAWYTVNKIDLTEFSQLAVTFKSISPTTYRNVMITAKQEIDTGDNFTTNFILAAPSTNVVYTNQWTGSTPYTATLSLEGFNGEYYVGWGVAMSNNYRGSGTVEVDEVLLR